ncbi:cell division protein ZapA [uncultured Maricaulis sp.]|uniref:cell division protein ZapA n=1 Tax=uncultured Maricaulis sp. TaxID=174710 RepID=UPI0030DB96B7|tara:strand:- start:40688 stop:41116 length:429 start_codon:yes stop_codon:yes gene_type:complete
MSKVAVTLNGRVYSIGCEEGQEAYLRELAGYLDGKVTIMANQVGQIGDLRLAVMASLIVVDELRDAERRIETLEAQLAQVRSQTQGSDSEYGEERQHLAEHLLKAAQRLEALAASLDFPERDLEDGEAPVPEKKIRFADARP